MKKKRGIPVPDKLGSLIELVNLFPLKEELEAVDGVPESSIYEKIDACWRNLESGDQSDDVATRYADYLRLRRQFAVVIELNNEVAELEKQCLEGQKRERGKLVSHATLKSKLTSSQLQLMNTVKIDLQKDGSVRYIDDLFVEATRGVDISLIRSCKLCRSVFWAGRIDQSCCSPVCKNRYWVNKHNRKLVEEKPVKSQPTPKGRSAAAKSR